MKGSGVVFTHGEGVSTPYVRHKGRQPLIECANMTLIFMFPFYVFISFIPFLYFSLQKACIPFRWKNPVHRSVQPNFFRSPMNCVFVHVSSTHEFGAMRSDCSVQFSVLNLFSEPHDLRFRSCVLHPLVWSHA